MYTQCGCNSSPGVCNGGLKQKFQIKMCRKVPDKDVQLRKIQNEVVKEEIHDNLGAVIGQYLLH